MRGAGWTRRLPVGHPTREGIARLRNIAAALMVSMAAWQPSLAAECVAVGTWAAPGASVLAHEEVLARAARAQAVLLGESHDSAEHHRWQLHVLAGLAALHPGLVLGLEMLPRSSQPALDRWVAGRGSEEEFIRDSGWRSLWGVDFALYAPLFHFARMQGVPLLALNIDRALVRKVGVQGFDALTPEERGGLTRPAPASAAYVGRLYDVFSAHGEQPRAARDSPAFLRFVEAQQLWDRAMAQAIAERLSRAPGALVAGLMGSGHVAWGEGVAYQLRDLGVARVASLLPWDRDADCKDLRAGLADAVFGVASPSVPARFRLGVTISAIAGGVRVESVQRGSAAEAAGLRAADVLIEAAGVPLARAEDLTAVVERAAAGYLLPLKARRQETTLDIMITVPPKR